MNLNKAGYGGLGKGRQVTVPASCADVQDCSFELSSPAIEFLWFLQCSLELRFAFQLS